MDYYKQLEYLSKCAGCNNLMKYEIVRKIGEGSFGKVYEARIKDDSQSIVAIKYIAIKKTVSTYYCEIETLKSCAHENVIKLKEICYMQPTARTKHLPILGLILEYCECDLRKLIQTTEITFHIGEIKNIMQQLLRGANYLHTKNILHRDLKPENIVITRNGIVKIGDLGVAIKIEENSVDGLNCRVGTLTYRSPELLLGEQKYGPSIDLWSLGCIMPELWNRYRPIMLANTESEQLQCIVKLCGSITTDVWPNVNKLPHFKALKPSTYNRRVLDSCRQFVNDPSACNLIDKLLILDPSQRISANKALEHEFFSIDPKPLGLEKIVSKYKELDPIPKGEPIQIEEDDSQSSASGIQNEKP